MVDAVRVRNLRKTFERPHFAFWKPKPQPIVAVEKVSFSIKEGEIFGLLGPNGAGKSTTINMLSGVLTPTSGEISIFGKDLWKNESTIKSRMNLCKGHSSLHNSLTVRENLRVYAELYCVSRPLERITEVCRMVKVEDLMNRPFRYCSSGERIRVMLAKALLNQPKLLMLDEPTVGMDPDIAEHTRALMRELNEDHGTTLLLTSHYMAEVEQLCDRIALLQHGKLFAIETPKELSRLIKTKRLEFWFITGKDRALNILTDHGYDIVLEENRRIIIEVPTSFKLDSVLKSFSAQGVRLDTIHTHEPNLEHIFIKLSRGELT